MTANWQGGGPGACSPRLTLHFSSRWWAWRSTLLNIVFTLSASTVLSILHHMRPLLLPTILYFNVIRYTALSLVWIFNPQFFQDSVLISSFIRVAITFRSHSSCSVLLSFNGLFAPTAWFLLYRGLHLFRVSFIRLAAHSSLLIIFLCGSSVPSHIYWIGVFCYLSVFKLSLMSNFVCCYGNQQLRWLDACRCCLPALHYVWCLIIFCVPWYFVFA